MTIDVDARRAVQTPPHLKNGKFRDEQSDAPEPSVTFENAIRTMHALREYVETGGLMSYGPNFPDLFRRTGDYVDKILRGTKPGDVPVEQPTKFDLVNKLTTAKAIGLTVPPMLLVRADDLIE
jgi:ABC-type uncharacterized transport system substrate-binding protein